MPRTGFDDGPDERPLDSSDNPQHGAFRRPGSDASMPEARARASAWWSLALAAAWLGGLGSLVALPLSIGALVGLSGTAHRAARVAAMSALILSVAGLGLLTYLVAAS